MNTILLKSLKLLFVWFIAFGVPASAADLRTYPTRPVNLVVPYSAGTATDSLARMLANKLSAEWGQSVIVQNQPGANGTIATAGVARAAPDGYTLIMIAANHVVNTSLYKNLPYDDLKDFRAIARIANAAFALCVNPSMPVKTVAELVELSKQHPGKFNYSSPGNGSPGHLGMEMFKKMSGANLVHIPYRGGAQATADLIGGQVQAGYVVESSAIPQVEAGKLRALVISSKARSAKLPETPTMAEAGYADAGFVSWVGVAAPAQVPSAIVDKVGADLLKIANSQEGRDYIVRIGLTPFAAPASEFETYMKAEHQKWAKVVKESGATLN